MKSTMSRYIDPGIADQLMDQGADIMGGQETEIYLIVSDVRSFATIWKVLERRGQLSSY